MQPGLYECLHFLFKLLRGSKVGIEKVALAALFLATRVLQYFCNALSNFFVPLKMCENKCKSEMQLTWVKSSVEMGKSHWLQSLAKGHFVHALHSNSTP